MHYSVIIKFNVSDAFLNLVLRSSMMLASSMALVVIRLTDFFSTLLFQMMLRVLAIIQTKGSLNFSSRLRSSKMACCGVRLGICFLRIWRSQRAMLLLKLQRNMAWTRLQVSVEIASWIVGVWEDSAQSLLGGEEVVDESPEERIVG